MNPANIVDVLIRDIKERLTLDGKNRVFEEGKELSSEFMKDKAEPEAFTKEFLIDKILDPLELEKLPEKSFETPKGHRSVDYRIKGETGMFLVEAKPLNANLFDKSRDGGVNQIKGLFRLAEVKEHYDFGVATDGLRWVFIDKNKEVVSDLNLETDYEQIRVFLVGKEKVISPKTEEEISKKFYDWYNALLHGGRYKDHENKQKTVSEADCLVNNIIGVKDWAEKEQIAQVVMNRLIFIKFLQSKGIIGEDILKYLSEVKEDLLTPKLRQLFFGSLDRPKAERFDIDERFKDVPYLNGSLFVHTAVERKNMDYKVRAEILKTVLQFLDSFTFVHKEQLGNGDSVDPEILGYIFERAMTARDRKGTGAYYTPKSITKYISENTIYPCIIEKTNEILKTEKGYKDAELIKDIDELFILPATTLKEIWEKIILKLRVLDNACGSGAFLLAAANILFGLNKKINDKIGAENPDTTLKIIILVNNLYGVDLNPNGIEIAKLRLWLWLADSYEPGYIKPLPNIDYNLRVGNSLIGYVDLGEFRGARLTLSDFLRDEEKPTLDKLLKERNDLIREYKITWGEEAKELKSSVQELDVKISNLLNADLYREFGEKKIEISREEFLKLNPFHWGFEFYEVFELDKPQEERGFDVVIGNPPYVRQEALGELKTYFQDYYYQVYYGTADLYVYFIERSFSLLTDGGVFSYIVANKWMRANYGKPLRQWLKQQRIEEILDFGDLPVFQVTTYPCIIRISKNTPELEFNVTQVKTLEFTSLDDYVKDHKYVVKQEGLDDSGWSLADDKTQALLDKIRHVGVPLREYVNGNIYYGIKTGFNNAFVIDADTRRKLIAKDAKSEELIKPFLVGRDIKRYQPLKSERYLIFTRRGIDIQQYPAIKRHLLQFKERLMPKPKDWKGEKWQGRKPGSYEWYEIQDTVDYYAEFEKPKILWPGISAEVTAFAFDVAKYYGNEAQSKKSVIF
ncbi:MAG: Eco57I restriction-modification methylase domain-containing protein [Halobacteriota archaeon]